MALYGVDFYGASRYGPRIFLDFDASPLVANPIGNYGQLSLSWTTPIGAWSTLRLIRNSYGVPISQVDGKILVDVNSGPSATGTVDPSVRTYTDTKLEGGRFQYYAIWLYSPASAQWVRAASVIGLPVKDYGYSDRLWYLTPQIMRTQTSGLIDSDNVTLQKFERVVGFQLDTIRAEYETLRDVNDPDKVSGGLLPLVAQQYGQFYEPELGMKQMRTLLANTVHLYRNKGTIPGIEGFVSAVSGYGAKVQPLKNLILDYNDSSAEESVGNWFSDILSPTLTRYVSDNVVNSAPLSIGSLMRAVGFFKIAATATGSSRIRTPVFPPEGSLTRSIPVTAGTQYTISAYLRADGACTANVVIFWMDKAGNYLGGEVNGPTATPTTTDWSVRATSTITAPATAVYAGMGIQLNSTTVGRVLYADALQFEAGAVATAYTDARLIDIWALAPRVNEVYNPSFEIDTAGWTGAAYRNLLTANQSSVETDTTGWLNAGNTTLARSTAQSLAGASSLSLTSGAAGDMRIQTAGLGGAPQGLNSRPVTAGQVYTVVASFRAATAPRQVQVGVYFYDVTGAALGASFGPLVGDNTTGWTQATLTVQAPATAAFADADLKVLATGATNEVHYVDAVGLFYDPLGNLVSNPDFENGTVGWAGNGGTSIAQSTAQAYTGRASLLSTTTAATFQGLTHTLPTLTVGQTYTASVYARLGTMSKALTLIAQDGANTFTGSTSTTVSGTWQRLTLTFTAALAVTTLSVLDLSGTAATGGQTFYLDAVQVVVGSTAPTYLPPTTSNLILNPSFEDGTTVGWSVLGGATVTNSAVASYVGTKSLLTTRTSTADQRSSYLIVSQAALAAGTYALSVWVNVNNPGTSGRIRLQTQDNGAVIANSPWSTTTNGWERLTVISTSTGNPAAGGIVYLQIQHEVAGTTGSFYLDAVQVELGSVATPYVDGSLGAGYVWEASENLLSAAASSFEDGTTGGWTGGAGQGVGATAPTIANSATVALSGTKSLSVTVTTGASPGADFGENAFLSISTVVGATYTASGSMFIPASGGVLSAKLWALNNGTTILAASPTSSATGAWVRLSTTFTATTTSSTLVLGVPDATTAGQLFYIDAVQVEQKPYVTAYAAPGTANASTSRRQTPWTLGGTGATTITRSNELAPPVVEGAGAWILRVDNVGGIGSGAVTDVVLKPATTYTLSAYCRVPAGEVTPKLQATETISRAVLGSSSATTVFDTWQRLSMTFTTGITTAVSVGISASTQTSVADNFFIDSVLLEKGSVAGTYFDGSTYAFTGESIWEGTGNNSRSHYYGQRRAKNFRMAALLPQYTPAGSSSRLLYAQPLA